MKVTVFGATGKVGQAMLAHCLGDPGIDSVPVVARTPVGRQRVPDSADLRAPL